jgi:S1-C subfamily serine protease
MAARFLLLAALAFLAACEAPEHAVADLRSVTLPEAPREQPAPAPRGPVSAVIEALGISVRVGAHGLTVVAMDLDGAAAQAGVLIGDVVLGVGGKPAPSPAALLKLVDEAGTGFDLQLHSGGAARQVAVKLSGRSAEEAAAWTPFGLQVRDLPDSARKALGVVQGVIVAKVRAPADRTRILPGDVIVAVDGEKVKDAAQFARLAQERGTAAVGLLVRRVDSDLFIALEPAGPARATGSGDASRGGGAPREERYKWRPSTGTPLRT